MNKKDLIQSIKLLTAGLILGYFLLIGGGGAQVAAVESQEPAAYMVQVDDSAEEVAFSFIINPITNFVNWAS